MTQVMVSADPFRVALESELRQPRYLTPHEVQGGWRELFPDLAQSLPAPYPIYSQDDEEILTHGYPVLMSTGIHKLRAEVDRLVALEIQYRLVATFEGSRDKNRVMAQRDRYARALAAIMGNTQLNDYGRGLLEVFLLFHSGDVLRSLAEVPRLVHRARPADGRQLGDEIRHALALVCADLMQRAAVTAIDSIKRLPRATVTPTLSPLLGILCQDPLLLTETHPPAGLNQIGALLRSRPGREAEGIEAACRTALARLADLLESRPDAACLLRSAVGAPINPQESRTLLSPRLLDALADAGLLEPLELSPSHTRLLRQLGLHLKAFELLNALRRRILPIDKRGSEMILIGQTPPAIIASSTRPFDFTAPGVVASWVRRFGLVYDLTNFTAILEEVRKKGRVAEEKALQFMYILQSQLEEIRARRRLHFEKFLGDGALYSSRQAVRVLAAAAEIQQLYDQLRHSGFPFDQGLRIAVNFGSYRLLPMVTSGKGRVRFEFFGHGIVELTRLTTGKSTREVEEIAEFLVHSGYEPKEVDAFLGPLRSARRGSEGNSERRYNAHIDADGELVNEGIVITVPFLAELTRELTIDTVTAIEMDGLRWAVLHLDAGDSEAQLIGLRHIGVARLKGLQPMELVEATVWDGEGVDGTPVPLDRPLIDILRRLAKGDLGEREEVAEVIGEDIVLVTHLESGGSRRWIFGEYRESDGVLLHAIEVPIQTPDLDDNEPLETWLFRNRFELARLYEGLRRGTSGICTPLSALRWRDGYLGCFLAAPHRAPG